MLLCVYMKFVNTLNYYPASVVPLSGLPTSSFVPRCSLGTPSCLTPCALASAVLLGTQVCVLRPSVHQLCPGRRRGQLCPAHSRCLLPCQAPPAQQEAPPEAGLPSALLDSAPRFKDILPILAFWWYRPGAFRPQIKG